MSLGSTQTKVREAVLDAILASGYDPLLLPSEQGFPWEILACPDETSKTEAVNLLVYAWDLGPMTRPGWKVQGRLRSTSRAVHSRTIFRTARDRRCF